MTCAATPPARSEHSRPTLADIVRSHVHELTSLSPQQSKALSAITSCRTAALGGHVSECNDCGHRAVFYNSCRNRHCPQCQGLAEARWVERRQQDLLPVEYFHVVITIPSELHELFLENQSVCYRLLFSTAAESLLALGADPKHIGGELGVLAVLHTWTQTLLYHPHLHCIVPGGGPAADRSRWSGCRPGFLLPVRALAKLFRGKLLSALEEAAREGRLQGNLDVNGALRKAARKDWSVYSKPSFAGPEHVIRYLGRYTHRSALSNSRIQSLSEGQVTFLYKDRRDGDRKKRLTLPADQFLRRFLLHVLPAGFVRVRYFGGLANPKRKIWLELCRGLLAAAGVTFTGASTVSPRKEAWHELLLRLTGLDALACPKSQAGRMTVREHLARRPERWQWPGRATSP